VAATSIIATCAYMISNDVLGRQRHDVMALPHEWATGPGGTESIDGTDRSQPYAA
jgi:hypothetical protein